MRTPAECYLPSTRPYTGLPELDYPFHDKTVTVTTCGRICFNRQKMARQKNLWVTCGSGNLPST